MSSSTVTANERGIPKAVFIEDVEQFVKDNTDLDTSFAVLQEKLNKYKFMEMHSAQRKVGLIEKIPQLEKNLQAIDSLSVSKVPRKTLYELSDTLYGNAIVPPTDKVCLWLGANVMLEYSLEEAKELLTGKLGDAKKSLAVTDADLEFLKEQITTMEVNIARVYNYDVAKKKQEKK